MLTLIHGGPAAADGDNFRADHYDWGFLPQLRAGWSFRPNYRGSSGYGDKFQRDISPQLVSRPAKTSWKELTRSFATALPIPTALL